jgi:hypothetical protein
MQKDVEVIGSSAVVMGWIVGSLYLLSHGHPWIGGWAIATLFSAVAIVADGMKG